MAETVAVPPVVKDTVFSVRITYCVCVLSVASASLRVPVVEIGNTKVLRLESCNFATPLVSKTISAYESGPETLLTYNERASAKLLSAFNFMSKRYILNLPVVVPETPS